MENKNTNKIKGLVTGFFIGILTTIIGTYLFVTLIMHSNFLSGINIMKSQGELGKIITLGAVLNIIMFFALLKFNKEMIARGVIFATILLTVFTLFV
jgi:hypothetical protein